MQHGKYFILSSIVVLFVFHAYESFAETPIPNPSTGDTLKLCPNGICSTGIVPTNIGFNDSGYSSNYTSKVQAKFNILAVILSPTCKIVNSGCPRYNEIAIDDQTDQRISGKFVLDKSGNLFRSQPPVKNSWAFYQYNSKPAVCIDCFIPGGYADAVQLLTILPPTQHVWVSQDDLIDNKTATEYSGVYIPDCNNAQVPYNYTTYIKVLHYMQNGCVGNLNLTSSKKIITPDIPWSYDNPYSSLHLTTYLKQINHNHLTLPGNHTVSGFGPGDCITKKCDYTDPYKKSGW